MIRQTTTTTTTTVVTLENGVRRRPNTRSVATSPADWTFRQVTGRRMRMLTASTSTSPRHTRQQCVREDCAAAHNRLH